MSLFPSTLTGRILDDGATPPPVIELQGISAGQLATVLTAYTPQTEHTANTAAIGVNAAAIAALQGQVAALPAAPDLAPYALAADLAAAEGSILANASGLVAVNTSLTARFGCQSQPERFGCSASRSMWRTLRRPTTPDRTRRCTRRPKTWRHSRRQRSGSIKTMQPSSSTTRSSRKVANADWKKRAHSELQQMQEEASNRSTDLLAMLPALIPWLFEPQMEPKLC